MTIKSDGVFTIQKGQGITQALSQEIGLSADQVKKLDNSIWTKVMEEIDKQKFETPDLYSGGNDINGSPQKNYIVKTGQVVKISLAGIWDKILDIVNKALGTNFEAKKPENESSDAPDQKNNLFQNTNIPQSNRALVEKYINETPHPELANQTVQDNNGMQISYDSNGYISTIFDNGKISNNINRDKDGNIIHIDAFDTSNDDRNFVRYNSDGNVILYATKQDNNIVYRNNEGHITSFNHIGAANMEFKENEVYGFRTMVASLLGEDALNEYEQK